MSIAVNCDMGEWNTSGLFYVDHLLISYIDICNVACAAHAGSYVIMKHTIQLAKNNNVKVGAHPGYADKRNFGRIAMKLSATELKELMKGQIDLFLTLCKEMNEEPYHIKPHGALYHACNHDEQSSEVCLSLMKKYYTHLKLMVAPGSLLAQKAQNENIDILRESFVDRTYTEDLKLKSRKLSNAVITDVQKAYEQFITLSQQMIITEKGTRYPYLSDTACIHGDNPAALDILKKIAPH